MAQTEDTELRDLVIEALEKNGSLAKIRALLRANIFLAFEDECENMRQNLSLDNVLRMPEGIFALSIVHEFLEFCNLKNTLFVYKSESRQGRDYKYEGKRCLMEKLRINKMDNLKEPILITLMKNIFQSKNNHKSDNDNNIIKNNDACGDNIFREDHNNSYIVHEDSHSQSSVTSSTQSDNSIDEKNKLHLRLQLDNSDTDTSTDSSRDRSASEYIPRDHIVNSETANIPKEVSINQVNINNRQELSSQLPTTLGNNSSDSTSYFELKPYSLVDKKMLNTPGLPQIIPDSSTLPKDPEKSNHSQNNSNKSTTLSSVSSISLKHDNEKLNIKKLSQDSVKSDGETDYSYDFTGSPVLRNKNPDKTIVLSENNKINAVSPNSTQNSQSSVSISDIADLISEKSSSIDLPVINDKSVKDHSHLSSTTTSKKVSDNFHKKLSEDSEDYSNSPIPSLSNLSLDIHSE